MSVRYAEATGDKDAYVLDEGAARAAGFAGIILHGLCTMALVTRDVLNHYALEAARLKRIGRALHAAPASRPRDHNQDRGRSNRPAAACTFEVTDAQGERIIRRGVAHFRE